MEALQSEPMRSDAQRSADEIRDVNTRYHDVAAESYDSKWGIDFGEVGQGQVVGKLRKVLGSAVLDRGFGRSLEVGAGTGYFSLNLLRAGIVREATCTDISPGMVRTLAANANRLGLTVDSLSADAESLPFADESFDLVLGHAVLHHLPDLTRAFEEFHRVLKPGGRIVFAGEPSRVGDRIAAIPKRGAFRLAPTWRRALRARPQAPPPTADPAASCGANNAANSGANNAASNGASDAANSGANNAAGNGAGNAAGNAASNGADHGLEHVVDIHAFAPADLLHLARGAGFGDVRVRGEELLANWFGWFNRGLEATAEPADVPMLWRQYAFRGYLLLQRVDERLLEPVLPPAIFYNLLVTARRP